MLHKDNIPKICEVTGKKIFHTESEAKKRSNEINKENKKSGIKTKLRLYKCPDCNKYHLSSMNKHQQKHVEKFHKDLNYRNEFRERNFIKRESQYWNKKFGIDND
jgi:hypothetical protein